MVEESFGDDDFPVRDVDRAMDHIRGVSVLHANPGDIVQAEGDSKSTWTVISVAGSIVPATDKELKNRRTLFPYNSEQDDIPKRTWVLQRKNPAEYNPVLTDEKWNKGGEGKLEQRRAIATITAHPREFKLILFTLEEEIASIELLGKPIEEWYLTPNRRSDTTLAYSLPGEVCNISDYIYFSAEGCAVREKYIRHVMVEEEKKAGRRLYQKYPAYTPFVERLQISHLPVVPAAAPMQMEPPLWVATPTWPVLMVPFYELTKKLLEANPDYTREFLREQLGKLFLRQFGEWLRANNNSASTKSGEAKRKKT